MPPLGQRRENIQLLALFFLARYNARHGKSIEMIPRTAMTALEACDWPGNVRELENLIERCVILTAGETLWFDLALLGTQPGAPTSAAPAATGADRVDIAPASESLHEIQTPGPLP